MRLTVQIERQLDGRFKGFFKEFPPAFYTADTEELVRERLGRLERALQSPHIRVDKVLSDGEVIMTLDRHQEPVALAPEEHKNGSRHHYMTLSEAMLAVES